MRWCGPHCPPAPWPDPVNYEASGPRAGRGAGGGSASFFWAALLPFLLLGAVMGRCTGRTQICLVAVLLSYSSRPINIGTTEFLLSIKVFKNAPPPPKMDWEVKCSWQVGGRPLSRGSRNHTKIANTPFLCLHSLLICPY